MMKIEKQILAYKDKKKGWAGLDIQIRTAIDEIEKYSNAIGRLESLDKVELGAGLESTIDVFKLMIRVRHKAIRDFVNSKRRKNVPDEV